MCFEVLDPLAGNEGKTTTAFGAHEWLIRAVRGEIETPMLERSVGLVSANELETNCGGFEATHERIVAFLSLSECQKDPHP